MGDAALRASGEMSISGASLTMLIVVALVVIVAITALLRARPEDVPKVFESFTRIFGLLSRMSNRSDSSMKAGKLPVVRKRRR